MLILYFEKFNFWRHHELVAGRVGNLAGRVGSSRVKTEKINPWTCLIFRVLDVHNLIDEAFIS